MESVETHNNTPLTIRNLHGAKCFPGIGQVGSRRSFRVTESLDCLKNIHKYPSNGGHPSLYEFQNSLPSLNRVVHAFSKHNEHGDAMTLTQHLLERGMLSLERHAPMPGMRAYLLRQG